MLYQKKIEFIINRKKVKIFNRDGIDLARMLRHYMEGRNNSWRIRWVYIMYKQNKYCIYPKLSKIQNIGFGEDATHCSGIDIYQTALDKTTKCDSNFTDDPVPDLQILKSLSIKLVI